jgi:hypothetical protein
MIDIPEEFPFPPAALDRQRSLLRAHVEAARQPQAKRRGAFALGAATALLGVLLAVPPFGLGVRLFDLFARPPAPPEVKTYFAASDALREALIAHAQAAGHRLHDRFSRVLADEARGVAAIESAEGPIYLWAAPTEDGRQCWLIQAGAEVATGRPYGFGSCDELEPAGAMRPDLLWTDERPSVRIVHVRVFDQSIERVDVELDGSARTSLPVVAGHALGTVAREARVLALVGRNADGDEVTRDAEVGR